jgi:gliding motility-associated-like protein
MRILVSLFALLVLVLVAKAQPPNADCAQAQRACAQQPLTGNNTGAVGLPGFCPATGNLLWYTFTTNSQGGTAVVRLLQINCPQITGMGNALSMVVLAGNGSCTPASFVAVSDCDQDSLPFNIETQILLPNTQYWVVVAGALNNGATIPAQCGFRIEVAGDGVDVIGIDFSAGPDREIGEGESTQLVAFGGPPYDWSPTSGLSGNDIPDPIASPAGTTTYTVTTVINGCTFSDQATVQVIRRIEPPNTFTPNGDGYNDTWNIPGIADYPGAEVLIFDRWGQRVYRDVGYREPWDGTNNGARVPVGTYYYHIQLNQLEGRSPPYTGFITVVR